MFGNKLKALREEFKMTQSDLGKVINVHERVIGYYESNNRFPKNPETLKKICQTFKVSADYLIGIEEQNRNSAQETLELIEQVLKAKNVEELKPIIIEILWQLDEERT